MASVADQEVHQGTAVEERERAEYQEHYRELFRFKRARPPINARLIRRMDVQSQRRPILPGLGGEIVKGE